MKRQDGDMARDLIFLYRFCHHFFGLMRDSLLLAPEFAICIGNIFFLSVVLLLFFAAYFTSDFFIRVLINVFLVYLFALGAHTLFLWLKV